MEKHKQLTQECAEHLYGLYQQNLKEDIMENLLGCHRPKVHKELRRNKMHA